MKQILKQAGTHLKRINPFTHSEDMPAAEYVLKKMLAFLLLYYIIGLVGGEVVILGGLSLLGYDALHGDMPSDNIMMLLQYYGFALFFIGAALYCKFVEKRTLKSMGFNKRIWDYISGAVIAVIMLAVIMGATCMTDAISYQGIGQNVDYRFLIALFGGLIVQSSAEEVLCRGFLMPSLLKKVSVPAAIFFSSTAFVYPHIFTLVEADFPYAVIGIINTYLVSFILSLLILRRSNIWIACGLHSVWNFLLYGVFGLTLSGSAANVSGLLCFQVNGSSILNGGIYGVEASIITTLVLAIALVLIIKYNKGRFAGENQ